ncbi:hypothetical protein ACET3Z_013217 [Daucus carota]
MAITIHYHNNTVTIDGNTYWIFDIPDELWVKMSFEYKIPIMFMQVDLYLEEEERLEAERVAAIRRQEWMIQFVGMMAGKLKQQREKEEDKAVKDKVGPSGI